MIARKGAFVYDADVPGTRSRPLPKRPPGVPGCDFCYSRQIFAYWCFKSDGRRPLCPGCAQDVKSGHLRALGSDPGTLRRA